MEILKGLEQTKATTLAYFMLPESDLDKTYAEGKWTVRELLHHLADAETVLYDRIRRGISKPNQVVWGFDQDAWCEKLKYKTMPLLINQQVYASVRASLIYLAENFYESSGENIYVHNETGKRTVKDEFDKVVWHNEHHLKQIQQAIKYNDEL